MPLHPDPRSLLTPAMRHVLERIARAGHVPLHALTPAQAKLAYEAGAGVLEIPSHKLARVEDLRFAARDGVELHAQLFAPTSDVALPVLLYFHGGGFTVGSAATHAALCRHLAHLAHCAVVSVDYRLAPEWKFPTAVHDAWDSLLWLCEQGDALGLDANRIAVGGDSAGGTLAAVTAIAARDAGVPLALQMLFYPGCAGHQDTASHKAFERGFLLEEPHISYFFGHYLRSAADRDDWRFAPLDGVDEHGHVRELDDVAPAWIGLAECDPLTDEGVMYADRLRHAGVPVDIDIYAGVVHGFINFGRAIPQALTAHNDAARALRQAFKET
ncbi:MAG: alpha/beta hydrolase [Hydrogenophaga sp.]|uniref:alpha/beta hydrolase n=1 Tax=Hydrogenophaga sp. TaxID=1904254 RepID=UPI00271C44BB|nr:alpha/beta hydrolase [Hydrogenophaga sp.]MDO9134616.1 alpha/beta hydrolase [Hydrogenophaga sp.]MDO9503816.1 alpha/beta hydrolase [Hydrogenophaga sp.]MDP2985919.1 alpha/beta hydrolase [Hydrogenophaga sp.]MDP3203517.1 alpha/beta hydrolase [Hydrogenophaga sp.]MDP3626957.1 alpha/beta hydrolase [Hydrogenophaga sp.]